MGISRQGTEVNSAVHQKDEPRWTGVREITVMSGPIILGSLSFAVMEFTDRVMVNKLGTEALAVVGSAIYAPGRDIGAAIAGIRRALERA